MGNTIKLEYKAGIKECPFCGQQGYVYESENYFGVSCFNIVCPVISMSANEGTEEEAINKWNKRA